MKSMTDLSANQTDGPLIAELELAGAVLRGKSCRCPYHDDKSPSAGIYQQGDIWRFRCHVCGVSGDCFDLEARRLNVPLAEVLKGHSPQPLEARKPQPSTRTTAAPGPSPGPAAAQQQAQEATTPTKSPGGRFFASREAITSAMPTAKRVRHYSYVDAAGAEVLLVTRFDLADNSKKFWQLTPTDSGYQLGAPPAPFPLYRLPALAIATKVIIVEGEKCADALNAIGFTATTSSGGAGKASTTDWSALSNKKVVLWPDCDEPGRKHMADVQAILSALPTPPTEILLLDPADADLIAKQDAADLVEESSIAWDGEPAKIKLEVERTLRRAKPVGPASDLKVEIEDTISGNRRVIAWPWKWVGDSTLALLPGSCTLVCGSPGASKSFLVLQAAAWWLDRGEKVSVFMLEESTQYHLTRALAQRAGVASLTDPRWVKDHPDETRQAYDEHSEFLNKLGGAITTSEKQPTYADLLAWMETKAKAGSRVLVIDPVTAVAETAKPWQADREFLAAAKQVATTHGLSIVLTTHPTKTTGGVVGLETLAGSAAFARFAQTAVWLQNHATKTSQVMTTTGYSITSPCEHDRTMHILKARNAKGGGLSIAMQFSSDNLCLEELGPIIKNA